MSDAKKMTQFTRNRWLWYIVQTQVRGTPHVVAGSNKASEVASSSFCKRSWMVDE